MSNLHSFPSFLKKELCILCGYLCLSLQTLCLQVPEGQEGGMGPLVLCVAVSSLMWVPGTEPRSSERPAGALSCWAISPAPTSLLLPPFYLFNFLSSFVFPGKYTYFSNPNCKIWELIEKKSNIYLFINLSKIFFIDHVLCCSHWTRHWEWSQAIKDERLSLHSDEKTYRKLAFIDTCTATGCTGWGWDPTCRENQGCSLGGRTV